VSEVARPANACAAASAAAKRSQPALHGIRGPTAPARQTITTNDRQCPRPATATTSPRWIRRWALAFARRPWRPERPTNATPQGFRVSPPDGPPKVDNRQLQTGTGTAQSTAINTVASTAMIFSLVDRSMVSSERVAPPISDLACLRCDGDHAPTGCLSASIAERACRLRPPSGSSKAALALPQLQASPARPAMEQAAPQGETDRPR
jgi:hypothetical protein